MPNPIKYTAGTETLALKKGNFYIGTGDVGKGPSDTTGYYQGPSPASGGYVIYLNKSGVPGNLSYHSAANDSELIAFTNNLSGTSFTSATECLNYYASQTDKVCFNRDYEGIVTNGLVLNLDAGFTPSYSRSGTTWYDVSSSNNGTLINGTTFNSGDGGSFIFDGADDYVSLSNYTLNDSFTYGIWVMRSGSGNQGNRAIVISNAATYIDIGFNDGIMFSLILSNGSQNLTTYGTMVPIGQWAYYSATYNQQSAILYLNGIQIASNNYSLGVGRITNAFTIGCFDGGNYNLNGKIAITQVYNRALTQSEITQNYNAQKSRFGL
jgi:hypothetical protein